MEPVWAFGRVEEEYRNVVNGRDIFEWMWGQMSRWEVRIGGLVLRGGMVVLGVLIAAELVFFVIHAAQIFAYPYPLDYGEGPLVAQVRLLVDGRAVWRLYADPVASPFAVVNYPPVYHLVAALVALPLGSVLLAGRVVSFVATLATLAALWYLSAGGVRADVVGDVRRWDGCWLRRLDGAVVGRAVIVLAFLGLPIVREWSVVMRVDMLGVCLGLWGLWLVREGRRCVVWAAVMLTLGLFVKPSLVAAPAAAVVWLFFRDRWRAMVLVGLMVVGGGVGFAVMQVASGGWFALHVVAANANVWVLSLAQAFWHDQLLLVWPLLVAAILGFLLVRWGAQAHEQGVAGGGTARVLVLLPLVYTLFGALTAFGVGKVGAYTNYFLEFYAGLVWLAAGVSSGVGYGVVAGRRVWAGLVHVLVAATLLRYYPVWSATYLQRAGVIEGVNPLRLTFGRYGVWQELGRERALLQAFGQVNATLVALVRAAPAPLFTDVPGLAAQAGQLARLQAFEHRQLFDAGLASQQSMLVDLANGQVPLVVLDYLGNWLTPEMISLVMHRYAQDGSRGTYTLYRPLDPGPQVAADMTFLSGPRLVGYHLAPSPDSSVYHPGEVLLVTLDWRAAAMERAAPYHVVLQFIDVQGHVVLEHIRPLLYDALPPNTWPVDQIVQHMQPISLPDDVPPGTYRLAVTLRDEQRELAPARSFAQVTIVRAGGQVLGGNPGGWPVPFYVPQPVLDFWQRVGGATMVGDPLMPAVPIAGGTTQCFVYACVRWEAGHVQRVPLGELIHLLDVDLPSAPPDGGPQHSFSETGQTLEGAFLAYWRAHGAEQVFGPPISGALMRGGWVVQYTRYARLEHALGHREVQLGRLGDDFLRLPGGGRYRWP